MGDEVMAKIKRTQAELEALIIEESETIKRLAAERPAPILDKDRPMNGRYDDCNRDYHINLQAEQDARWRRRNWEDLLATGTTDNNDRFTAAMGL